MREAEHGAAVRPIASDARGGTYNQTLLARVYLLTGRPEKALDILETLVTVPFYYSRTWLRIDPTWAALCGNPRFARLTDTAGS